jgi:uncharacterized membrane protein YbaN (DUF454 family)
MKIIGWICVGAGVLLLFLPGPGLLLLAIGFLILAQEYPWARRILDRFKAWLKKRPPNNSDE